MSLLSSSGSDRFRLDCKPKVKNSQTTQPFLELIKMSAQLSQLLSQTRLKKIQLTLIESVKVNRFP